MMRRGRRERGFTLIESMAAMAVMMVGAVGLMGLFTAGTRMNGNARRLTRATAIAQDLLNNIAMWQYPGAGTVNYPLSDVSTSNNADIADTADQFESVVDPIAAGIADHGETDITNLVT